MDIQTKLLSIILVITLMPCTYAVGKSTKIHRLGGEGRGVVFVWVAERGGRFFSLHYFPCVFGQFLPG